MVKVKLLRPSNKMTIVAQPRSLPRASGYCFSKRYIICTADKDWNEKIKTSMNKLIDVTVAFDAIAGEQMSGTLLCDALSLPCVFQRNLLALYRTAENVGNVHVMDLIYHQSTCKNSFLCNGSNLAGGSNTAAHDHSLNEKKKATRDINAGLLVERGWAGPTRPCLSIAFCKTCFTKFVEEMWNQDGVTGKKLGIQMNQKEEGDWTFLTSHHCQRANTMNNLLTFLHSV